MLDLRWWGFINWLKIRLFDTSQVYRLHQLNRAAQLVTALSFTVRGAEMTPHNLAINSSLGTLLNVLQFLGVICIWSLSSFLMRFFPSATILEQWGTDFDTALFTFSSHLLEITMPDLGSTCWWIWWGIPSGFGSLLSPFDTFLVCLVFSAWGQNCGGLGI